MLYLISIIIENFDRIIEKIKIHLWIVSTEYTYIMVTANFERKRIN